MTAALEATHVNREACTTGQACLIAGRRTEQCQAARHTELLGQFRLEFSELFSVCGRQRRLICSV